MLFIVLLPCKKGKKGVTKVCQSICTQPWRQCGAALIACSLQDGTRVPFKVKRTTLFDKLFKAYCQKKALDQTTLVFMNAEGQRVLPHQTPAEVSFHELMMFASHGPWCPSVFGQITTQSEGAAFIFMPAL